MHHASMMRDGMSATTNGGFLTCSLMLRSFRLTRISVCFMQAILVFQETVTWRNFVWR